MPAHELVSNCKLAQLGTSPFSQICTSNSLILKYFPRLPILYLETKLSPTAYTRYAVAIRSMCAL